MKIHWDKLNLEQQNIYIEKAEYLLEKGYVTDKTALELARRIYESS